MTITINGTTGIAGVDGSASTPAVQGTDTNTGIFFPAADTIAFAEGGAEAMRIDSDGDVGIGTTSPSAKLHVVSSAGGSTTGLTVQKTGQNFFQFYADTNNTDGVIACAGAIRFDNGSGTERARFDSSGNFLVKTTSIDVGDVGCELRQSGLGAFTTSADVCVEVNRLVNDGTLVNFRQDSTTEGTISVSGSTVSYNGGNLSRWAQLTTPKDDTPLFKGTVMSNLDEMNVYTDAEGNPVENEQLNKVKVSDVESDVNVAGVFVNWDYDDAHQVDEINMAMTGDMIIRIAQGVVVQKGDLLMSAGDGTAKPQEDDIVRSKTVAKVTSNHVTCTYEDGSYCVPCVLMAC
jgi:hypothetical protein